MKKVSVFMMLLVLVVLACAPAFAVTTYGPGQYVTLNSGTKNNSWQNAAHVYVDYISIGGNGYYIAWIRDKKSDKQVTGTFYFEPVRERKTMLYLESKKAYVKSGRKYDMRAKSNSAVAQGECGTIYTSSFVP